MSHSRHYARPSPRTYYPGAGDPRGGTGVAAESRTIFRYQLAGGQWGSVAFVNDPVRYNGRPYLTDIGMIAAAGIANGTTVTIVGGFGGSDVYEFRKDGNPAAAGHILVAFAGGATAADVLTAFINAASSDPLVTQPVQVSSRPSDTIRFAQITNFYGGRTGFDPGVSGQGGVCAGQSVATFLVTVAQTGFDPVELLPAQRGGRRGWIGVNAQPTYLVS